MLLDHGARLCSIMQWTPPSTIFCNESSFCVTKPICLFCCFSCCFFFQVKGGGTVGNAITAASGLGLNARIFTKARKRNFSGNSFQILCSGGIVGQKKVP